MNILKKLFGGKETPKSGSNERSISYLKMVLKDFEVNTDTCDICGATLALPTGYLRVFTSNIDEWHLDVGGVCLNQGCSNLYRVICPKHMKFISTREMSWYPGCQSCGKELHPGQPEVMEIVNQFNLVRAFNSLRVINIKKQK